MGEFRRIQWEIDAGAVDRGQAADAEEFRDIEPGTALRSSFVRPSSRSWMLACVIGGVSYETESTSHTLNVFGEGWKE